MSADSTTAFSKKTQNRHLYQLVAGKTISDIGSNLDMVGLNMYAYVLTGSALQMGMFMAVRLFTSFLVGFYSGILADRLNRKTLMIFSDVIRSVALFGLILAPHDDKVYLLYLVSIVQGGFSSMFGVALQSSIPVIVGSENRIRANSIMQSLSSIAMIIGLAGAGTLLGLISYNAIFCVDAASYLISAANLISLPIITNEVRTGGGEKSSVFSEIKSIFIYLRTLPILLAMMLIRLVDAFGSSSHNVGMPIFSAQLDPARPSFYMGITWASWAAGNLIGARIINAMFKKSDSKTLNERAFGIATIFMSIGFILIFWSTSLYAILPFAVFAGIFDGICTITFTSRVQQVPDEKRGRVFGVVSTLATVGFGVGMVICSPLLDHVRPAVIVSFMHGFPMLMALIFSLRFAALWRANQRRSGEHIVKNL